MYQQILLGKDSQGSEAYKAGQFCSHLNSDRKGKVKVERVDKQDGW